MYLYINWFNTTFNLYWGFKNKLHSTGKYFMYLCGFILTPLTTIEYHSLQIDLEREKRIYLTTFDPKFFKEMFLNRTVHYFHFVIYDG